MKHDSMKEDHQHPKRASWSVQIPDVISKQTQQMQMFEGTRIIQSAFSKKDLQDKGSTNWFVQNVWPVRLYSSGISLSCQHN